MEFKINSKANGWYIGENLIFGGLIGHLIVDHVTGAMWNLEPEKHEQVIKDKSKITIKLLSDLANEQKANLKPIK